MPIDIKRVAIWNLLKIIAVENKKWWSLKRPHHLVIVNKQEESCLGQKVPFRIRNFGFESENL
jgi:hypothetical protein